MARSKKFMERIIRRERTTKARSFVETVMESMLDPLGGVVLLDLGGAVELLWAEPCIWDDARARRRAMREVDEQTRGQAFRLDTPMGPLFLDTALWRFAGRSGLELDEEGCPRKDRPDWVGKADMSRSLRAA